MTVLDTAREVLKGEPVCEWCLGRCFADTGSGISTAERGHALRVACAMEADEAYEPIAPTNCWVCGGIDVDYEAWAQRAADALAGLEFETFQLGTRPPNGILENDRALRRDAGLPKMRDERSTRKSTAKSPIDSPGWSARRRAQSDRTSFSSSISSMIP